MVLQFLVKLLYRREAGFESCLSMIISLVGEGDKTVLFQHGSGDQTIKKNLEGEIFHSSHQGTL